MKLYIIGTSGSGKSTLARALEKRLGIKHIEMDTYLFEANWVKRPREDYVKDIKKALDAKDWIMCGNFDADIEYVLQKSDQIIWLDYSFPKIFWQTTIRTFRRIIFKEPCCNGNIETFYQQFCTKYSIFWWIITTYPKRRREYAVLQEKSEYKAKWLTIHNQKELDAFLANSKSR